ncbi:hypothetical protein OAJ23_01630 [Pelagibacteraceae bacterium]|nr:hypothetical protein [Pelagibacteraceae bacterium]
MNKKLNINKTTQNFISSWSEVHTNKFRLFTTQSMLCWNVIFLIADATLNNYELTYEDICKKVNHRIGSRSSIQNVLGNSLLAGYVQKKLCHNDKRAKYFHLTKSAMYEFEKLLVLDADSYEY